METLRLVDVAGDGQLVLMSNDGRRFVLAVDAEVRAAVRRDRARIAEDDRSERPGPREVQARIRAGADAEEVAAATGLDVEYVRRFEGPVLAERRHVADLGRALPVHRDPGSRPSSLETVVVAALVDAGHDADRIQWDSRKVEGTRWDVEVFAGARAAHDGDDVGPGGPHTPGPVHATWRIDVATRSIEELDDTARRLTALDRRRLSPVRDRVFDLEAGRSRRQQQAGADVTASTTASILEALALQRGRRPGETRDDADGGASPGQVAAAAASPRQGPHQQDSDRHDEPHESDGHARDHDHPGGREGRSARIAAFAPRRQPTGVDAATSDDDLPFDGLEDRAPANPGDLSGDLFVDQSSDLSGPDTDRRARPEDPDARLIGGPSRTTARTIPRSTERSAAAGGTEDSQQEFPPAPDRTAGDGPAIEPFLLGELDLDPSPRAPAHPVRRNGTPPGPRTVAAPGPPRRTDDTPPSTPAPQRSAPPAEQADSPTARRSSKRRRAAVPSWDDIVFGARVDDD